MRPKKSGFTLVELLVVIGIIALLISILLPALNKARQAANTVKDLANLRAIGQGLQLYAAAYNGYIPGSPNTTGFLLGPNQPTPAFSNSNTPGINGCFDWETPMLNMWGVQIPYSPTADAALSNGQARYDRVSYELNAGQFTDPANTATTYFYNPATAFPGAANIASTVPYMSYCESMIFLTIPQADVQGTAKSGVQYTPYDVVPGGYTPKVTKIGTTARKIFVSDGSRYLSFAGGTTSFDMSFSYNGTQGGNYADWGAFDLNSNGMRRASYPGNGGSTTLDERVLWARHGSLKPGQSTGYKFDAVFYDGHAETLTEEDGSNPIYWMPKGTTVPATATEMWPDVIARYNVGSTYTCPE